MEREDPGPNQDSLVRNGSPEARVAVVANAAHSWTPWTL